MTADYNDVLSLLSSLLEIEEAEGEHPTTFGKDVEAYIYKDKKTGDSYFVYGSGYQKDDGLNISPEYIKRAEKRANISITALATVGLDLEWTQETKSFKADDPWINAFTVQAVDEPEKSLTVYIHAMKVE